MVPENDAPRTFRHALLAAALGALGSAPSLAAPHSGGARASEPLHAVQPAAVATALAIAGPRAVRLGGRIVLEAVGVPAGATCRWSIDPVPGAGSGRVRLVNPKVSTYANGSVLTVYGKQVSAAANDVQVRLSCTVAGNELRASAKLTCVDGGLTAFRPQHGGGYFPFLRTAVAEVDEEDPARGPGIRRSDVPDVDPSGEDDLIEVRVQVQPAAAPFVLVRQDPTLAVWTTRNKAAGTEVAFSGNESAPLSVSGGATGEATVWVEWTAATHGLANLRLRAQSGTSNLDALRFHSFQAIVMALGGEDQSPQLPRNNNNGTFVVGTALYGLGYDVHLYDEDNVSSTGAGSVYNEAVSAIRDRGVSQAIVFGYSHGGGSTYDLAERLDANRAAIGTFTIPFTSYVDGVENDSDFDIQQENKYPPSSAYHANQYQRGSFEDFFLDGGPVPGSNPPPSGLDVETTPWGFGANHFVVDDFNQVRDFIRDNLDQRVTP